MCCSWYLSVRVCVRVRVCVCVVLVCVCCACVCVCCACVYIPGPFSQTTCIFRGAAMTCNQPDDAVYSAAAKSGRSQLLQKLLSVAGVH